MYQLIGAGVQAIDAIDKAQKAAGDLKVQKVIDQGNAAAVERQAAKQAANVRKAGAAQASQVASLLSQAGVAGTSPTAQLLNDTLNQNVESDIMQTLLQGKLASLNLNYRANQLDQAAKNTIMGSYLNAGATLYSGYVADKG